MVSMSISFGVAAIAVRAVDVGAMSVGEAQRRT